MSTTYESRYASSPSAVKQYDTQQLREEFLVDNLMEAGNIRIHTPYLNISTGRILLILKCHFVKIFLLTLSVSIYHILVLKHTLFPY